MRYVVWVAGVLLAALEGGPDAATHPGEPISAIPLQSVSVTANTGEKPQSKLWCHDGRWWAVLPESSGTRLWRLDGAQWSPVLHLSDATATHADALRADGLVHVLLFETGRCELISLACDAESHTYGLWPERTSGTVLTLNSSVETATIDMDASGRLWLAMDDEAKVVVRWSDAPYSAWSAPLVLATGMAEDDICALTAFPNGGVGVLWSNQLTRRYGFRFHPEGADPADWLPDEAPSAASALPVGDGMSDDHINFATAQDGTLYAAVKTSYDTPGYPLIGLLVRRPSGAWDDLYSVDDEGTRPIVVLDEKSGTLFVAYTHAGNIVYRESPSESIAFGPRHMLIEKKEAPLNNVTSTKERFSGEIVFLASTPATAEGVQLRFP
ncbi:MAG TPA: hypothetical protein PLD73_06765 [Candidatus Hydrogenedentes bacterium]|jgi:hypothetical protein|nr:hypothetical protein [Candidatus Hydrogenedentota bacterium]